MNMYMLASGWSFGKMLQAIQETVGNYGKIIIGIIGLIMVIVSVYQISKNLISHGKTQTNWVITFALLIVGGALMLTGGWDMLNSIAKGGQTTIDNLGKGNADKSGQFVEPSAIINGDLIQFD